VPKKKCGTVFSALQQIRSTLAQVRSAAAWPRDAQHPCAREQLEAPPTEPCATESSPRLSARAETKTRPPGQKRYCANTASFVASDPRRRTEQWPHSAPRTSGCTAGAGCHPERAARESLTSWTSVVQRREQELTECEQVIAVRSFVFTAKPSM